MKTLILGFSSLLALTTVTLGDVGTARAQYGEQVAPAVGPDWNNDGIPDDQQGVQAPQAGAYGQPYVDPQYGNAPYPVDANGMAVQNSFGYYGSHPIPYDHGGGYCSQEGPHVHDFPVFDRHLFRESNGYAYFVGDPTDFGYASTTYVYGGNHPLDPSLGGGYCYMDWPHRHSFAPFSTMFVLNAGAYMWTGAWAANYYADRSLYVNYFGGYYRNYYLGGRYFSLRPSHAYIGWGGHRPMYRPGYGGWGRPGYAPRPYYAPARPVGGPIYRAPGYQAPVYRAPGYQAPVYRAPMVHQPAPVYRAPMVHQPAPVYRAPMHQSAPVYRAPMHQSAPAFRAPMHQSAPVFHGGGGHMGHGRR